MTGKDFFNRISGQGTDVLKKFLELLAASKAAYCVIGGLAVNAYVEPVVSLDLDVVIVADKVEQVIKQAELSGYKVERFKHSVNLSAKDSELRFQLQLDSRYQEFLSRAAEKSILGYSMPVACVQDVINGKLWAYQDSERRKSKRQKDLADIFRLIEAYPALKNLLPADIQAKINS